jgi:hypothetical protein
VSLALLQLQLLQLHLMEHSSSPEVLPTDPGNDSTPPSAQTAAPLSDAAVQSEAADTAAPDPSVVENASQETAPAQNVASPVLIPIAEAVSFIIGGDAALVLSGASSIKSIAMKADGEAQCVEAGACDAISKQLANTDDASCVTELCKAMINTAGSAAGFSAHLSADAPAAIVQQLLKPNLSLECAQLLCKAAYVLCTERTEGQVAFVKAGAAPALVSLLKLHTDPVTLLRVSQAIASIVSSDESCQLAFVRSDVSAAITSHLSLSNGTAYLVPLVACAARLSTTVEGKRELLKSNIAPAIVSLIEVCDEEACALVACTAARLAFIDEGDDALSKAGIAAAIIKRFQTDFKSQALVTEIAKAIGNIASNPHYNSEYCCVDITRPLAKCLSNLDSPPHVTRQVLRAISAVASVDGKPSAEGQAALLQSDIPAILTKLLHICTDNSVVVEVVRAMRVCAVDCPQSREEMQALGAMSALFHQLEKQHDIKAAAEIYSSAQVILAGGPPLILEPAPVDNRTFFQKLLCYPNRIKVELPPADRQWNIESGLSVNPRLVAIRQSLEQAGISWNKPVSLKSEEMIAKWESVKDVGMEVLGKSSIKVKLFGLQMSKRTREAVIYALLAVLVTLYAVLLIDSDSAYFLKRGLQSQLEAEFPCTNVSNYAKTFYDIQDADGVFMWLQGVVLPFVYSGSSTHRPQCVCQTEEFVTCSGPHGATNSDIMASKTRYIMNATSKQYYSISVPVTKRGLPFLAEAVCTDEGSAGAAAISYAVSRVNRRGAASRFFTSGQHFLRNGDPFHWVAPNLSRIPSFIAQQLDRTLYIRDADGANASSLGFWFEVSLSPRCLAQPCPPTEFSTNAINLDVPLQGQTFDVTGDTPALTLYLDRPCLPDTPCMSECGKRDCPCNEAHGFANISKLNEMPPAKAGPVGGSNILVLPPRLRNSVVKPSSTCLFPASILKGHSDGVCWPEFSSDTVQKNGDAFINAYTAAFGEPDAQAKKWLTYSAPIGSTFLPSNTDLLRFYGSGGFLLDIPIDDFEAAKRVLHQAKTIGWWNRNSTRALSLELAFYNPNVNRFITVQYLIESPHSSGIIHGVQWRHSTLTPWSRPYNFAGLIIQYIMFGMNPFLLLHLRSTYLSLGKEKFWDDGFMSINLIISVLLLIATCISIYVLVETARVLVLRSAEMDHHVIYSLLYWNAQVSNLFTVIAWLIWIRVVEFLDILSPKTKILQKVIVRSAGDIAVFSLVFAVYLMGFGLSRMVAMGMMHPGFRTLGSALNTQMIEIFVSYDYVAFREANPVMGPLYFVVFTLVIILLMVNMLAAIVERFVGICKEESDATKNSSEQDISDYSRRLLKKTIDKVLRRAPAQADSENWLEMWAKDGELFQKAGIMSVQELISAADLNCDGSMSMVEFLDFIKKNAETNEEAMFQVLLSVES